MMNEIDWMKFSTTALTKAALTMFLFLLGLYLTRKIRDRLLIYIQSPQSIFRGLQFRKVELVSGIRMRLFVSGVVRTADILALALLTYAFLSFELSYFETTAAFSEQLLDALVDPLVTLAQAIVSYLPNVLIIVLAFFLLRLCLRLVYLFSHQLENGTLIFSGFHKDWAKPTYQIVRFLLIVLFLVGIFPYLPFSSSPAFQGMSVFLGVLLSFGSTSAVSNLMAGLVLTYMNPFRVGDRVRIDDTEGDVIEKNLLVTRVRTIKNVDVTIPNALVLSQHVINYSGCPGQLIIHTTVTIGYDEHWTKIHGLLIAAATSTKDLLASPAPFVLQTALNDHHVAYQINAYTDAPAKMAQIKSDLHQNIQEHFRQAQVEILSPVFAALRSGAATVKELPVQV